MKRTASVSDDEAIIRRLRKNSNFSTECLKASLEDHDATALSMRRNIPSGSATPIDAIASARSWVSATA